jgi:hypothetical protein
MQVWFVCSDDGRNAKIVSKKSKVTWDKSPLNSASGFLRTGNVILPDEYIHHRLEK